MLTPARRRVVVGATAALLLAGGLVAVQSVGGPAPAAIAVEVAGEWTTVRLVDIDADPDAVVAQLRDAGFTAERQTLDVVRTEDGDGFSVSVEDSADSAGIIAMAVGSEGGEHGVVGLTVAVPEGTELAPPPEGGEVPGAQAGGSPTGEPTSMAIASRGSLADDSLLAEGIRFEADGGVSLRAGTDVTIVVATEA